MATYVYLQYLKYVFSIFTLEERYQSVVLESPNREEVTLFFFFFEYV